LFVVGRNPQKDSNLPYLLRLPLEGGLVLKARERWPAITRVYCHRFEEAWPEDTEVVEQTPSLLCRRRGAAIDPVLDRPRLARSQFVFTQAKGREAIFWQTQKTARAANPGGRIPRRRSLTEPATITVDTRERYPYRFAQQAAETVRASVPAGDYAVQAPDGTILAAVERKSLGNLAATLSDGTLAFQMQRLAELPLAAVVIESPILGPLQARTRQRELARRPTHPTRGSLPGSPARIRRHPPLRRRLDVPLPHHSTHRHDRPNPKQRLRHAAQPRRASIRPSSRESRFRQSGPRRRGGDASRHGRKSHGATLSSRRLRGVK
jgi:hypothetical protein